MALKRYIFCQVYVPFWYLKMESIKCVRCNIIKKLQEFNKDRKNKTGRQSYCRVCQLEYSKNYRIKNPNLHRKYTMERNQKYYRKNKKEIIVKINNYNKQRDFGLYFKYWSIRRRCNNPNQSNYKHYGGRGIKIMWNSYIEFKNDMYIKFLEHQLIYGHKNTTIERMDVNGNYCKENCKWVTRQEQAINKRNSII